MLVNLSFYEFSKTNFNDANRQNCLYMLGDHISKKSQKKKTFRYQVKGQTFSTVINEKSRFNGYFNSDFDDFFTATLIDPL